MASVRSQEGRACVVEESRSIGAMVRQRASEKRLRRMAGNFQRLGLFDGFGLQLSRLVQVSPCAQLY